MRPGHCSLPEMILLFWVDWIRYLLLLFVDRNRLRNNGSRHGDGVPGLLGPFDEVGAFYLGYLKIPHFLTGKEGYYRNKDEKYAAHSCKNDANSGRAGTGAALHNGIDLETDSQDKYADDYHS